MQHSHSVSTYQINIGDHGAGQGMWCKVHRNGKLVTYKRARTERDAVREALTDVRRCRRGGMLVKR